MEHLSDDTARALPRCAASARCAYPYLKQLLSDARRKEIEPYAGTRDRSHRSILLEPPEIPATNSISLTRSLVSQFSEIRRHFVHQLGEQRSYRESKPIDS